MDRSVPHYRFSRDRRLRKPAEFADVRAARAAKNIGPLRIGAKPNALPHCRLGLAVSRRVGNAVARNRVKRRLREAFRLQQHQLPPGYDLVISARAHEPASVQQYQQWLRDAAAQLDELWRRRENRS